MDDALRGAAGAGRRSRAGRGCAPLRAPRACSRWGRGSSACSARVARAQSGRRVVAVVVGPVVAAHVEAELAPGDQLVEERLGVSATSPTSRSRLPAARGAEPVGDPAFALGDAREDLVGADVAEVQVGREAAASSPGRGGCAARRSTASARREKAAVRAAAALRRPRTGDRATPWSMGRARQLGGPAGEQQSRPAPASAADLRAQARGCGSGGAPAGRPAARSSRCAGRVFCRKRRKA